MRILGFIVIGLVLLSGCAKDQSAEVARLQQENAGLKALVDPPPASLDALYPPKSPVPAYQLKMFEMAGPMTGMVLKVNEGDRVAAKSLFEAFKAQYVALSKLVPEWETSFPMQPVDELAAVIEQGDPEKVMAAVERVGGVCHNCHVANMANVQQKFHWADFEDINLSDPVMNKDIKFKELMMFLDMSFSGMVLELQQGQMEKSRAHLKTLKERFGVLKTACQTCHDTERKYFVDSDVEALLGKLETALKAQKPDGKTIAALSQEFGMESCGKCHLVHIPAAYAKASWAAAQPMK